MVENVSMMWLKSPRYCYDTFQHKLRRVIKTNGAEALANELSDMCDEYWSNYCEIHDRSEPQTSIQAFYIHQAMVKLLRSYGWWDEQHHKPMNWSQEESYDTKRA